MSTASRPFAKLPRPVQRLLLYTCAGCLFVGVSAVLNPDKSLADAKAALANADFGPAPLGTPRPVIAPKAAAGRPLLGSLVGSPYHIWVYAGAKGPVYTVADMSGKILATEVTAEELYQQVPGAAVDKLHMQGLDEGVNIMVVPDRHD